MTMTLVSTVTVGAGGAASINFTSIPQTGTDLLVVFSLRSNSNNLQGIDFYTNGSWSVDSRRNLTAINGGVSSDTQFLLYAPGPGVTSNTFGSGSFYMTNYTSSSAKSVFIDSVVENNSGIQTNVQQLVMAGRDSKTVPITSLSIGTGSGVWVENSTASLYLITKGSGGATVS